MPAPTTDKTKGVLTPRTLFLLALVPGAMLGASQNVLGFRFWGLCCRPDGVSWKGSRNRSWLSPRAEKRARESERGKKSEHSLECYRRRFRRKLSPILKRTKFERHHLRSESADSYIASNARMVQTRRTDARTAFIARNNHPQSENE